MADSAKESKRNFWRSIESVVSAAMAQPADDPALLDEQIAYYKARAPEYDEWWLRQGQFDFGDDFNRRWRSEIDEVRAALDAFRPDGDVLELAAGTGGWTTELARHARSITAVDASAEALRVNADKVRPQMTTDLEFVEADLFEWRPERRYDVVFFSFWLTHVPPARFVAFWDLVDAAMNDDGRFFLVDNARTRPEVLRTVPHTGHTVSFDEGTGIAVRRLNDGRRFHIVKVWWEPAELERRLSEIGFIAEMRTTADFFLYGHGRRSL